VFLEPDGTLVDEVVEDHASDTPTLLRGAIVKTQFAGPGAHREICEVLREIRKRFAPDLTIDDETGFATTGDESALLRAFAAGWDDIRTKIEADRPPPGARFQVGEFPFEVPETSRRGELAALPEKTRNLLLSYDAMFAAQFGGFGTTLDHSRESILDLELAFSDLDDPGVAKDPGTPEIDDLVLLAGAYFGRTLVSVLGGAWDVHDEQLVITDVGGCGLIVDPFEVARDRVEGGPPFSFPNHFGVYQTFTAHLARDPKPR
jgi:hypothetical protein